MEKVHEDLIVLRKQLEKLKSCTKLINTAQTSSNKSIAAATSLINTIEKFSEESKVFLKTTNENLTGEIQSIGVLKHAIIEEIDRSIKQNETMLKENHDSLLNDLHGEINDFKDSLQSDINRESNNAIQVCFSPNYVSKI